MKQYKRSARFNALLQEEISAIIQRELKDPRIGFVSVTRVESTEDLRSAKVFVSVLDDAQAAPTLEALRHAAGNVRGELMHRIRARRIPELRFVHDQAIAHSVHIGSVLEQLRREREAAGAAGGEGPKSGEAPDEDEDEDEDEGGEGGTGSVAP